MAEVAEIAAGFAKFAPLALQVVAASLAVGLASYVLVLDGLWRATRTEEFRTLRGLWTRACLTAVGVALAATALVATMGEAGLLRIAVTRGLASRTAEVAVSAVFATALIVGAVSAWRLRRDRDDVASSVALRMAIGMSLICAPLEMALAASPRSALVLIASAPAGLVGIWGAVLCWRSAPERSRPFLLACVPVGATGLLLPLAWWIGTAAWLRPGS